MPSAQYAALMNQPPTGRHLSTLQMTCMTVELKELANRTLQHHLWLPIRYCPRSPRWLMYRNYPHECDGSPADRKCAVKRKTHNERKSGKIYDLKKQVMSQRLQVICERAFLKNIIERKWHERLFCSLTFFPS
jgi:hypothetical protein